MIVMQPLADAIRGLLSAVQARPATYATVHARCADVRALLTAGAGAPDPAVCTTAKLCELLQRIYHPGADWFLAYAPLAAELLNAALVDVSPKTSPHDPRDKFIYTSMKKGKPLGWIKEKVRNRATWDYIDHVEGISMAAKRYAKRQGLPWPIER